MMYRYLKFNISTCSFVLFVLLVCIHNIFSYFCSINLFQKLPLVFGLIFLSLSVIIFLYYFFLDLSFMPLMGFILIGIILIISLISNNFLSYSFDATGERISTYQLKIVMYYFIYYCAGLYFIENFNNKSFRVVVFVIYIIHSAIILINIDMNSFILSYSGINYKTYQIYNTIGDKYAILSILSFALYPQKKYAFFIISSICLFLIGSRTAFFSYLFVIIILITKYSLGQKNQLFLSCLIFFGFLYYLSTTDYFIIIQHSRMIEFFITKYDSSLNSRATFFFEQWPNLLDHWLYGDYAGQVSQYGSLGSYIHNYLSLWRQYGLIPFVCFVSFTIFLYKKVLFLWIDNKESNIFCFVFGYMTFMLVEIIISRSYSFPYIWFGLSTSIYCIAYYSGYTLALRDVCDGTRASWRIIW